MCDCDNDELYRNETDGPDWDDNDWNDDDWDDRDDEICYPEEFDPLNQGF